ncbi:hypothetical protein WA026_011398 [Henosepilachna vigintioctopunctata]|uniref:Uncharacterized protein n=1 Tax=Henosepilachna vigintioctopunctata TaxID=420089 RepID=A0AAW1TKQ8_9CUCU
MDLDNPSYFSIAVDSHTDRSRNGNSGSISSSSDCSLSRQLTPPRNKMSFRSFGRSISNNTTESSQFLRGEPRLSDLAPDLAAKHMSRQNSQTKTQNGLVYSSLAMEPESGDSGDEVFLEESTARYYNMSAGNRRHSLGAIASRERTSSLPSSLKSFPEELAVNSTKVDSMEVPGLVATSSGPEVIDDHSIRHGSYPRKRCNKCVKEAPTTAPARGYIIERAIDSRLALMDSAAPEASSGSLLEFFTCPMPVVLLDRQLLAGRRCSNFESKQTRGQSL